MKKRDGQRRKVTTTGMEGNREKPRMRAERARGQKKRSRGEKASKKCSNMAKRAQIASLAISRGGGKKTIFATDGTSGAEKYSPERRRRRRRGEAGRY